MEAQYKDAGGNPLQVLGQFEVTDELDGKVGCIYLKVVITNVPQLNLTWETNHGAAMTH